MRPKIDKMAEVTRLTREGRFTEAMAVLGGTRLATVAPDLRESTPKIPAPLRRFLDRMGEHGATRAVTPPKSAASRTAPSSSSGAHFTEYAYADRSGLRSYKLYVPSGYRDKPVPLVVMLHGCTQSPDDFAAGTRMNELAEAQTFLVAYPAQTQSANSSKCWNWFNLVDQQRDRGEPALIAGMTRQIMQEFRIVEAQVYVAGLSAGGAAAAIMGATYPDLYAGVGVHSGLACGAARTMASALDAMRHGGTPSAAKGPLDARRVVVPTIVFHGDQDKMVNPINADQVIAQARAGADLKVDRHEGKSPDGMRFTQTTLADQAGRTVLENWILHGAGHAWSGGSAAGSYTNPRGPDASREMVRFFLAHHKPGEALHAGLTSSSY